MAKFPPPKNVVLYADDDVDDLQMVKEAFQLYSTNVELYMVLDGASALSYLKDLSSIDSLPCLIILDINLPKLDGKETLRRIRTLDHLKDIPVIFFTTSISLHDKEFAERHKAGFITKPLNVSQMEAITDQFIEHCTDEIRKNISRKIK